MGKPLAIFFALLYILAMLKPVMPVFQYIVKQDYIAEYLCINKDRPMLQCNGKCYLAKQLAAQRDQKKQNLPSINLQEYPIGFVKILSLTGIAPLYFHSKSEGYLSLYDRLLYTDIFHPPAA